LKSAATTDGGAVPTGKVTWLAKPCVPESAHDQPTSPPVDVLLVDPLLVDPVLVEPPLVDPPPVEPLLVDPLLLELLRVPLLDPLLDEPLLLPPVALPVELTPASAASGWQWPSELQDCPGGQSEFTPQGKGPEGASGTVSEQPARTSAPARPTPPALTK
jgi:hypothetical protein